jgi:hypothetical protein
MASRRFVPRATLTLVGGFALFLASSLGYALPALLETPPAGAIADYRVERVRARLEGKALYFLAGSLLVAALASATLARGRE